MKKSGVGSVSLVLIFAVLVLAVFALITYTAAENEKTLALAEAALVKGYYEADAFMELQMNGLISGAKNGEVVELTQPVSSEKELYVSIAFDENTYTIRAWGLRNTNEWINNKSVPVWNGN